MKARIILITLITGFSILSAYSQRLNKAELDSFFTILADKNKAMGSLVISKNGAVVYKRTIGYSSISDNSKKPATESTKYRIGSISKMFTATMVFQLIDEGKLNLTTTLDTYFPQIPNANKITIGNLLNHRSGLHNFTNDPAYMTWMVQPKTEDEMIAVISKSPVDFQPNEKASYSNSNFVVLGYVIEKVSKQSYARCLTERITSKIGLSSTYVGGKTNIEKGESFSYAFTNGWKQQPETDMSIPGGAGAIVSTPADMAKFIEALFALKLTSSNSLNQMKTITEGYGMGMFQIPFFERKAYGHNGGIDGFGSTLTYFPEDSLAVAYCTNGQVYPMNDILIGVLSIYFGKGYSIPVFNTVTLKSEDLDKYLGVYSSQKIPLKITITKDNATLIAQATGQSSFPLQATDKDKFEFEQAGIKMEFDPDKKELILKQGGGASVFTKE
ncbi:MAG: peptidase [Bacteroidota bacterium]|nr:peptidase [Bacteroidota bacterium]